MLNGIKFPDYQKCYPVRLKKFFQSDLNYKHYDEYISNMERAVVGNIPPEIIKLFNGDKGAKIKSFQNSLAEIAQVLRSRFCTLESYLCEHNIKYLTMAETNNLTKNISTLFDTRLKSITGGDMLHSKFEYEGQGSFGCVYRFSLFDKNGNKIMHDKAFKVYRNINEPDMFFASLHNNHAEANFWVYIKNAAGHNLEKTQFTKHYISDLKSGYCMTEFIDGKLPPVKSRLELSRVFQLLSGDKENNTPIGNRIYDVGGMKKTRKFMNDKVVLRYYKKLAHRNSRKELQTYVKSLKQQIENNPKFPQRNKIIKALELFKEQYNINSNII